MIKLVLFNRQNEVKFLSLATTFYRVSGISPIVQQDGYLCLFWFFTNKLWCFLGLGIRNLIQENDV